MRVAWLLTVMKDHKTILRDFKKGGRESLDNKAEDRTAMRA